MTRKKLINNRNSNNSNKIICCKNFPSTSNLDGNLRIIQINYGKYRCRWSQKQQFIDEITHVKLTNIWENEKEIISTIMQRMRQIKKGPAIEVLKNDEERNEWIKGNFNWINLINTLRSFPLILLFLLAISMHSPIQTVMAKLKNSNNGYCEPNSVPLLVTAETATLFGRACRCAFGWHANFCKQMKRYKSLLAIAEIHQEKSIQQLPIVCICRQLSFENNCQQFMTQCYFTPRNQRKQCACCFNQPDAFCNQLQCRNGEPLFDMHANTTCICHAPTFYPYNICTAYHDALFYDHNEDTVSTNYDEEMEPHYINRPLHEASMHHEESTVMKLYGIQITPTLVIAIVLGLLGVIILLTTVLLVVRSCRTHREHRNRAAKRELAQSVLLEQRAEEEKYLP